MLASCALIAYVVSTLIFVLLPGAFAAALCISLFDNSFQELVRRQVATLRSAPC